MSTAINFCRVGIYNEEFPSIKSLDPLITWSCEVTYNILVVLALLRQGL